MAKSKKGAQANNERRGAMHTKKKRKLGRKQSKGGPRGQAEPLRGEAWNEWLEHIKKEGGAAWLYPLFFLMHALCFRVGQVLILRGTDFNPDLREVWAVPFKHRKEGIYKNVLKRSRAQIKELKERGHSMRVRVNQRKTKMAHWKWCRGLLFPATRAMAKDECMNRFTVARAIKRAVKTFKSSRKDVIVDAIRSHTAKHNFIHQGKCAGAPDAALQKYAEINDADVFNKVYGKPNMTQSGREIDRSKAFNKIVKGSRSVA